MKTIKSRLLLPALSCAGVFLWLGCNNGGKFINTAPSDLEITVSKCYVVAGGTVKLSGSAEDEDGDPLTYYWKAGKGSFIPSSAMGDTLTWKAPSEAGTVTITMTVTDDLEDRSTTQTITVCTQFPTSVITSRTIENSGNAYILTNTECLRIASSVTLTIEPGVTIIVDSPTGGFEVYGHLIAQGTPALGIRMQGNSCTSASGLWAGLYLSESNGQGTIAHMDLSMSNDGIQVGDGAILTIQDCELYDNANMGISVVNEGSAASIRSCKVWDNGTGIYVRNAAADIQTSSIRYSAGNGLELDLSADAAGTMVTIDSCTIANNGIAGIQLAERAAPEIHYCSIFSNGESEGEPDYGIRLSSYTATDSVRAEYNYWGVGTTTQEKISALIYDKTDNPMLADAYVSFVPWLSASPVVTAPLQGKR
jgi:hypothetical protein